MKSKIFITAFAALIAFNLNTMAMVGDSSATTTLREQIVSLVENLPMDKSVRLNEEIILCFKVDVEGNVVLHEVVTENKDLASAIHRKFERADLEVTAPLEEQLYWITINYKVV